MPGVDRPTVPRRVDWELDRVAWLDRLPDVELHAVDTRLRLAPLTRVAFQPPQADRLPNDDGCLVGGRLAQRWPYAQGRISTAVGIGWLREAVGPVPQLNPI